MREVQQILQQFTDCCNNELAAVLITLIDTAGSTYRQSGAYALYVPKQGFVGLVGGGCIEKYIAEQAVKVLATGLAKTLHYDSTDLEHDLVWGFGMGCAGAITLYLEPISKAKPGSLAALRYAYANNQTVMLVFDASAPKELLWHPLEQIAKFKQAALPSAVQQQINKSAIIGGNALLCIDDHLWYISKITPARHLLILGAGMDVLPVVEMGYILGWKITVIEHRASLAKSAHFTNALVYHRLPKQGLSDLELDASSVALLMSHHYTIDQQWLPQLLQTEVAYIGLLGSTTRRNQLFADLELDSAATKRIFSPVGLNIGAESPEEIALAIFAEIYKILSGHDALPLSTR